MSQNIGYAQRTHIAFLWTSILGMPFWAIYTLLVFILYKDLHATPLQIAVCIALKPLVSLFSLYWSAHVNQRRDRLKSNVMWASILGPLPFLFFPIVDNPWFLIISSAFYMTLVRGVFPAWMEILKLNLSKDTRQKLVSYSTTFSFVGGGVLSLLIGWLMDDYSQIWRWVFPVTAILSILSAFLQYRIIVPLEDPLVQQQLKQPITQQLVEPWKNIWNLLRTNTNFRRFHFGFMLGGFGLVILQPALPEFFIKVLNLSYVELTTAVTLCKGIAFALTSSTWAHWLNKVNIYRFSSVVALLAGLFPLVLFCAQIHVAWIFVAYLLYGVMQSGSELCWHLSGPIFAKGTDSSLYSSVNLAIVGLRGCVAPLLGSLLLAAFSPGAVLIVGSMLSLAASWCLHSYHQEDTAAQSATP